MVDPILVQAKGPTRTGGKRLKPRLENEHIMMEEVRSDHQATPSLELVILLLMFEMFHHIVQWPTCARSPLG
jgi:hypothetical protein